ncbi:MAG: hypothetical protein HYS12_14385, partial [Planctomycetes bacterium]|nr:hypothetical protein [Planctomycetota bacterium]
MCLFRWGLPLFAILSLPPPHARAGLYYSGEEIAPLPSQWRGFLIDQRLLRTLSFKPASGVPSNPLRQRYEKAVTELEKASRLRKLSADELADLGALHVRLGNGPRAIEVLRAAQRDHPRHFKITSNLGTAWQMHGDLVQAEACLREAVRLAPGRLQPAEELQRKLVQSRQRETRGAQDLDNLLDVHFVNDKGEYEPGRLGAVQRKKLRADAGDACGKLGGDQAKKCLDPFYSVCLASLPTDKVEKFEKCVSKEVLQAAQGAQLARHCDEVPTADRDI